MAWYDEKGNEYNYVLSTRVRFARNLVDYPFAPRLDKTGAAEIAGRAKEAFCDYEYTDFTDMDAVTARSYAERRLVSPAFLTVKGAHGLLSKGNTYIMVGEEDHLRIQSIYPGLALDEAYAEAAGACDAAEEKLKIAYDDDFGYLTHCPTNLGTGMRASVMMFLPALTMTGAMSRIAAQLGKLGLTVRGTYGEGSEESGYLYQVSNQVTLGISEADTVEKLKEIVSQIIENEKKAEKLLTEREGEKLRDRLMRSIGTLRYATMLSSAEFMQLYGKARFALNLGYTDELEHTALDRLSVITQPAMLGAVADPRERDILRAEKVRKEIWKDE